MRFARALAAALLLAAPAAAQPPGPLTPEQIDPLLGQSYFGVYVKDRRVGEYTAALDRLGTGPGAAVVVTSESRVRLAPGSPAAEARTSLRAEYDGRPPYALRVATFTDAGRGAPRTLTLEHTGDGYEAIVSQAGEAHRFPAAVAAYTLSDALAADRWVRSAPPAGATLAATELEWWNLTAEPETHTVLGPAAVARDGRVRTVIEVEVTNARGRVCVVRYDPATRDPVGYVFPTGEEYRVEPALPVRPLDAPDPPAPVPEVVPCDRLLGHGPFPALRVTINGYAGTGLTSGPGQTVVKLDDGRWACRLGRRAGEPLPLTPDDAAAALAESVRFPFRHKAVTALARQAVGDARTERAKIDRLVRFVHRHVRYERAATPELFELLQTRTGNCQSYALLFVALARAEGIPAREVVGLMYAGDAAGGFGPHQWAEAARDGVWHPVDSTTGAAELDATYIRIDYWPAGMSVTVAQVPLGAEWLWAGVGAVGLAVVVAVRVRRAVGRDEHRDPEAATPADPPADQGRA